jgi:DNA-binding NarL/FixJ family response regulator
MVAVAGRRDDRAMETSVRTPYGDAAARAVAVATLIGLCEAVTTLARDRRSTAVVAIDDEDDVELADALALLCDSAVALHERERRRRQPTHAIGWESLTPTELLVVEHVEAGLTHPEIAAELLISRYTVKTHLAHIFTKLDLRSRSELAAVAARRPVSM